MTYSTHNSLRHAEHELLLCGIRPDRTAETDASIRSLVAGPLDWDYLFQFARRHGVLQLLCFHLQHCAADLVPPDQLQRLQKYFRENTARNVLLTAELCRLIELLSNFGIEAVPYKGPALASFAYSDIALRRFVDLDVIVRKEHVDRAIELLLQDGYEFSKPLTASQRDLLLRSQHNVQFRRNRRQLIVELHWEVASHLFASSVQSDDLWSNLGVTTLNQTSVKTLTAEDLVFSLCVHGSRHLWERLLWICDIGWIVARHELDWSKLLDRAKRTASERMFLLGLNLAGELLAVRFPDVVQREFDNDSEIKALAVDVNKGLFSAVEHLPATNSQIFLYNWKIRRAWSSRARYLRHVLRPTDRDVDTVALPGALSLGYYVTRPIRLLFKSNH